MPRKYGITWSDEFDDLNIELACFKHDHSPENGGLGKAEHFRRAATILWGNNKRKQFIWHPWADKMLEAACQWKYLSVAGAGGIGKSEFFAIWAIINWMSDPIRTMVVVTSTTLKASRKRIWGCITEFFNAVPKMPGKLVDSIGIIRTLGGSDKSGITLVAGEAAREKESMDKLIGCHNNRVILIGDELPALSHALVKFATTNLSTNPDFQFIGIGNPRSKYDPHGLLSKPKDGWVSITEEFEEWETELGYAIRFDAEKSPNILAGRVLYPWLPKEEDIALSKHRNGPDSLEHWSQCRGFWPPEGSDPDCVYSENDIANGDAEDTIVEWMTEPTPVAFCDPAWTHGGDACRVTRGLCGPTKDGNMKLLVTHDFQINDKRSDKRPRIFQVAEQYINFCKKNGVMPRFAGYDATGGGHMFGDVLSELWDAGVYACNFAGSATEIPCGPQALPANEMFADRVSEIWMCGLDFLRSGQIKGLTSDIINDLIARKKALLKQGMTGGKIAVEPKRVMKKRIRRSPDAGDSALGMLDLCRMRLKFRPDVAKLQSRHARASWTATVAAAREAEQTVMPTNLDEFDMHEDEVNDFPQAERRKGGWQLEVQEEINYLS